MFIYEHDSRGLDWGPSKLQRKQRFQAQHEENKNQLIIVFLQIIDSYFFGK